MTHVSMTVNGDVVEADIEPRTHLGDFLREHRFLTGTHLGCEHGICGACTVQIDGASSRSCIALAVACDGADVRTVEGFDDDPLMRKLREAFTREHALQCGYCTPGMLISAHDLVRRLPEADEDIIRREMEGNLCRCTGYVGIVRAVASVVGDPLAVAEVPRADSTVVEIQAHEPATVLRVDLPADASRLLQSFRISQPVGDVWNLFRDIEAVATCMPGAEVTDVSAEGQVTGRINVGLGPIRAGFGGRADVRFDDTTKSGIVIGSGNDGATGSGALGEVTFALADEGGATRVDLEIAYSLSGALAQFGRGDLAAGVAQGLINQFAANLELRLAGETIVSDATSLDAGSLVWQSFKGWVRKLFWRGLTTRGQ